MKSKLGLGPAEQPTASQGLLLQHGAHGVHAGFQLGRCWRCAHGGALRAPAEPHAGARWRAGGQLLQVSWVYELGCFSGCGHTDCTLIGCAHCCARLQRRVPACPTGRPTAAPAGSSIDAQLFSGLAHATATHSLCAWPCAMGPVQPIPGFPIQAFEECLPHFPTPLLHSYSMQLLVSPSTSNAQCPPALFCNPAPCPLL